MATVTREQELLSVIYKLTDALEQANGRLWKCGGESVTPEMTESERAALASPPAEDDIRAAIQGWALYCFKRHGNDAHLYNGLAALGGVDVDGKGWQAQAPPASDPPRLGCESPSNCDPKLDLCTRCQARTAPNGLTPPSWITARQSDPPGLVDVVRAWQEARTARMELFKKWEGDEYGPAPFDEVSSISFRMDEATKALDAYPLPASPQAETKGDES